MGLAEMWEKPWFKWTVIIVVILILILAAIVATLQKPTVESVTVTSVDPEPTYVNVYLTLDVKNPNFLGGTLKELDADVYRDGNYVGPATLTEEVEVKGSTTTQIDLVLRVERVVSPGGSWDAAGTATIEVFGTTFDVPFDSR